MVLPGQIQEHGMKFLLSSDIPLASFIEDFFRSRVSAELGFQEMP